MVEMMRKIVHEKKLADETGYTRQALRYMRVGYLKGKYKYSPILEQGRDWLKIGASVCYTASGVRKVKQRAAKRGRGVDNTTKRRGEMNYQEVLTEIEKAKAEGRRADLSVANLRGANLSGADLSGADLSVANLSGAIGNCREVRSIHCFERVVTYTSTHIFIGCKTDTIEKWFSVTDEELNAMSSAALVRWRKWEPIIKAIITAYPATPTGKEE